MGLINLRWLTECLLVQIEENAAKGYFRSLVVGVFSVVGTSSVALIPSVRNRIFADDGGSGTDIRDELKTIAKNIIDHHYWIGVGLNNYTSVVRKYDNSKVERLGDLPCPCIMNFISLQLKLASRRQLFL